MIIIFVFTLYFLFTRKQRGIVNYMAAFVLLSVFSGVFLGLRSGGIESNIDIINSSYIALILFLLIHAFKNHNKVSYIHNNLYTNRLRFVEKGIIYFGISAFFINLYIVSNSLGLIFSQEIVVQEYKNEGDAASYLIGWVPSFVLAFTRFVSPIGYLALGLHFFYLTKNRFRRSFLFMLISLNIPLLGLHGLSRSSTVLYILLYCAFYIYVNESINFKIKNRFKTALFIILLIVVLPISIITNYRFEKYYYIPPESRIDNPIVYSTIHYFSQWSENGLAISRNYSPEKLMYGKTSTPIILYLARRFNFEIESIHEARERTLGIYYATKFNGIAAALLYDFGYFISILFTILFLIITRKTAPVKGNVNLSALIWFGLLVPLPLTFFTNNILGSLIFSLGLLYTMLFSLFVSKKKDHSANHSKLTVE